MSKVSFHQCLYKWTAALLVLAFALGAAGAGTVRAAPKIPTVTSVAFSAFPAAGSPLTVTATIAPASATGTVSFTATLGRSRVTLPASCANAPVSGGNASCTFTPASTGTYTFTAKFTDTKVYASSTGNGSVVVKLATSTALSFSASPTIGSPVTVTATVSPAATTGTVAFTASGISLPAGCASAAISGGQASCTFTPTTAVPYNFTATSSGDSTYAGSAGSGSVSPARIATQTTISFSASPAIGSPVTVTGTVTPAATGTVDFTATLANDPVALPASCTSAPLSNSQASCTFTPAAPGSYAFTAAASGDTAYAPSTGTGTAAVMILTTTIVTDNATTIPGGPAPVTFGGTIVFTATVSSASGTPNGTIQWTLSHHGWHYGIPEFDSEIDKGSGIVGACQGDVPVVNGVATCEVTPRYWYNAGNGGDTPFFWAIDATATFTPAADTMFVGSAGSDSTTKITLDSPWINYCGGGPEFYCPPPQEPHVDASFDAEYWPLSVEASDSLNRSIVFTWCLEEGRCPFFTSDSSVLTLVGTDLFTVGVMWICPEGISPYLGPESSWDGSFECLDPPGLFFVTFRNITQD